MRSRLHPSQDGFTLIELLVVISIIAVLIADLMPAAHRVRREAAQFEQRPRLGSLGASLRSFAVDAEKIRRDVSALTLKAVASGEAGSLGATELQTLCGDMLDTDNAASLLLAQMGDALGSDPDTRIDPNNRSFTDDEKLDRAMMGRTQMALAEAQTKLRQLEDALSKVYACGPIVVASNPVPDIGQRNGSH